jgi:hypothetical protein
MAVRSAKKTSGIVTGHAEVDRKLARFAIGIQKKVAREELKKVTKKLITVAQNNLQAAGHVDEGKLLKGIKDGAGPRSRSSISRIVRTTERKGEGTNFGGAQIELGGKNTQPDSFLRKALYDNEKFLYDEVIKGIERHIGSIAQPFK